MNIISFTLEGHPAGPDFVRTAAAFRDLAEDLRIPLGTLRQHAWWQGAGEPGDFVHEDTLTRFAETAISRFGEVLC